MEELGFIQKVNLVAESLETMGVVVELFDPTTVAILDQISSLEVTEIVNDLKKSNYLGNRKLDINLALNNASETTHVAYSQANLTLKDGTVVNIPFQEQQQDLSWVTMEFTSHADIKNYIQNSALYTSSVFNTELTVEEAIGDNPALIRFRDTDGYSSNLDRVQLIAYSGNFINGQPNYVWTDTTSSLQTLANRAADILLLGQSIDEIIVLANITDELQALSAIESNIVSIYTNMASLVSIYGNMTSILNVDAMSGDITATLAMSTNITNLLANSANINTVASNMSNIVSAVSNLTDIAYVIGMETNIDTVVAMEANISSVVSNATNINSAVANAANITTVSTNIANVNSVAAGIANVATVATNMADVDTVVLNIADINTNATNIVDLGLIATNIVPNIAEILNADANATAAALSATQAANSATNASNDADSAATSAAQALTYSNQITGLSAQANTLIAGSQASASYNSSNGILTLGIPQGAKGDKGDPFTVDAIGTLAGRVTYDNQTLGFSYLAVDTSNLYFKQSNTTADWSAGVPFGKGDTGDQGLQGLGWYSGNGVPSAGTGSDGEYYLDEDTADVYQKVAGSWGTPIMNLNAGINDVVVDTLLSWSSSKITAELALKSNTTHTHTGVYEPANANIQSHISNTLNPHGTTKAQVGLSNVDNTSDANKPVSTATQTALNLKADKTANTFTDTQEISAATPLLKLTETDQAVDQKTWGFRANGGALELVTLTDAGGVVIIPLAINRSTGAISISSTIDGRDLAVDGAKLDGIVIGSTVAAYNHTHTGVYEPADATILKDADIGVTVQPYDATLEVGANKYIHPTYAGDDFAIDTTLLTGATVISDLAINVTTDAQGHVTDANASVATRTLTLANLGYTGATNANNYTHPSYVTTNINTAGATIIDSITTTDEGHISAMATRVLTAADLGIVQGSGNGFDADTVDGVQASVLARNNISNTFVGSNDFYSTNTTGDYTTAPIEVREVNLVTNTQSASQYAPAITYHWGSRFTFQTALHYDGSWVIRDGASPFLVHFSVDQSGNATALGNVTAYSDIRVKENITPIENALWKVKQLSGYTFDRTDIETPRQAGVIAQEVQKVLPEVVTEDADGKLSVAYGNMVGLLIEAIKELTDKNNQLEARLEALEGK